MEPNRNIYLFKPKIANIRFSKNISSVFCTKFILNYSHYKSPLIIVVRRLLFRKCPFCSLVILKSSIDRKFKIFLLIVGGRPE